MPSRLSSISSEPMLREYAQGAAQQAIQPVADFIAPTIPVATSVGKYKVYTEKNRFHPPKTLRAIGGRATELSFDVADATYNCQPHALDYPVDNLEQLEQASLSNALMEGATAVAEVASLVHEQAVLTSAVTAAGGGTSYNFTSNTVDPVDIIDDAILTVLKAAKYGSLMGIGILFGATAFKRYKNNANVKGRYTTGGASSAKGNSGIITPGLNDVSTLQLGSPEVRGSFMVYDSAPEGKAANVNFILDTDILVFARLANPTRRDPSFMKTFRLMGNYMVPGSYTRDDGRVEVAKFDWSEQVAVTNSAAVVRVIANNA